MAIPNRLVHSPRSFKQKGPSLTMPPAHLVFTGAYTETPHSSSGPRLPGKGGIRVYRFDRDAGTLEPCGVAEGVRNPSYLAFHPLRPFLYAVNELKEFEGATGGAVSAFAVDAATGKLTFLNQKPTHGADPCHLAVDPTGRWVLVANYSGGSVCVLPVHGDGSLGDATDVVQHRGSSVHPVRQAGPHAHYVTFDRGARHVFVCDLGMDKVMIYRLDAARGALEPHAPPWVQARPGAGPRQLVFHPQGDFAYTINELNSTITAFRYDAESGILGEMQTVPTLPHDFTGQSTGAELRISPSGDHLYASNRGHDSIAIFAIDRAEGTLTCTGHESTRGRTPRGFALDPTGEWLLAANQDSDTIAVFRVHRASGRLTPAGDPLASPKPVCVKFF